jgi:hypothetical protein
MFYFVILSEAKNLSSIEAKKKNKEGFFASLRMTAFLSFYMACSAEFPRIRNCVPYYFTLLK